MLYHILAVGDVVMEPGLRHLERHLRPLQKWKAIDFTVVNGENAAGVGLTRDQAERIYDAGADVVTLGNHAFGKSQIADFLEDAPWLLRPANYTGRAPGRGCGVYDLGGVRIRVLNLIGRCDLAWGADNPFTAADRLLERDAADFTLVDFHAEATSEKGAMAWYLDGRAQAVWGTHTHVPTADCPASRWRASWGDCRAATGRRRDPPSSRGPSSRWTAPPDCAPPWSGSTYGDRDDFKPAG